MLANSFIESEVLEIEDEVALMFYIPDLIVDSLAPQPN